MVSINTNALRDALALLLRSAPTLPVEIAADAARAPTRAVGQTFQALLVAELPNGRSLIEIQGFRLDVKLPVPARIGDTLQMRVLALEPRLTFALVREPAGAGADQVAMSQSARNLVGVLDTISRQTPEPAASRAPVLASPPATGSAAVLASVAAAGSTPVFASAPGATGTVHASALAGTPVPAETAAFAESLKSALTRSGLFYESHQAQWVAGERPLGDLMHEPQAALKAATEAVHPQTVTLVQQQLDVLDTRQIVWNGQVWPGQTLDWRIEEEPGRESAGVDDSTPVWKTSLRLHLPRLGEVFATLAIRGDELHLAFSDLAADTRSAVRAGQTALHEAFANAGLQLIEIKVDQDEA